MVTNLLYTISLFNNKTNLYFFKLWINKNKALFITKQHSLLLSAVFINSQNSLSHILKIVIEMWIIFLSNSETKFYVFFHVKLYLSRSHFQVGFLADVQYTFYLKLCGQCFYFIKLISQIRFDKTKNILGITLSSHVCFINMVHHLFTHIKRRISSPNNISNNTTSNNNNNNNNNRRAIQRRSTRKISTTNWPVIICNTLETVCSLRKRNNNNNLN